jgi:hypothetical protein
MIATEYAVVIHCKRLGAALRVPQEVQLVGSTCEQWGLSLFVTLVPLALSVVANQVPVVATVSVVLAGVTLFASATALVLAPRVSAA